jgi:hypothetical protein
MASHHCLRPPVPVVSFDDRSVEPER